MKKNRKILLSTPHMSGNEKKYIEKAFVQNWIAPAGPNIEGFESDLKKYCGTQHTLALSSGTAAIHLSLLLLNVQKGDVVICQSLTFCASANPIKYVGAVSVFVDSEVDTWNMDPVLLEEAIEAEIGKGKMPKAIILVHLYGMPAKVQEIQSIANRYRIPIIEDAAEAMGSEYKGKKCGSLSKLSILSFNGNKIITTSGGGALLSDDISLIQKAKFWASQSRDQAPHYQHSEIGYNYLMSNVLAGIGRGQMEVLEKRVDQRRNNFVLYKSYFKSWNELGFSIEFQEEPVDCLSNRWLTCILVDPKKNNNLSAVDLRLALAKDNIEARPIWKPMHLQPLFREACFYGNNVSASLFQLGLCLPSGSNLTNWDFDRIFAVFDKLLRSR